MAADSLVTEKAVVDLANAINANKAGKSELEAIANAVDALPVMEPDMTNFAALIQVPVGGTTGASSTPGMVVVPAGQPAPTDLPDGVIVVMEDPTGGTAA